MKDKLLAAIMMSLLAHEAEKAAEPEEKEDERGSGRTTKHALIAAKIAIDKAGSIIEMQDHSKTHEGNKELALKVSQILTVLNVDHAFENNIVCVKPIEQAKRSDSQGPLPEWAVGRNPIRELVPGAQLYTRNGSRVGNAYLLDFDDTTGVWEVLTDMGSAMHLTVDEVNELFTVGEYIADVNEVESRRKK